MRTTKVPYILAPNTPNTLQAKIRKAVQLYKNPYMTFSTKRFVKAVSDHHQTSLTGLLKVGMLLITVVLVFITCNSVRIGINTYEVLKCVNN